MCNILQITNLVMVLSCTMMDIQLNSAQPVQIIINSDVKHNLNLDLYGFSTESLFFDFDINDREYTDLILSLRCHLFRFPGGGISSIYHWDGEGYGIIKEEAQQFGLEKKYLKQERLGSTFIYTDAFIKLVKITRAKVLLVANVLTESPERFIRLIDYFYKNGVEIAGIELGSEVYLKKWRHKIGDITDYLSLAEQFAGAIKNTYPQIKIGAVAAPSPQQEKSAFFRNWNENLAKKDFYDAYIIHPYLVIQHCDGQKNLSDCFNCAGAIAAKYLTTKFYDIITYYHHQFGGDKSIWITEWNISPFGNDGIYGNTNLQNLYAAEFMLNLAEFSTYTAYIEYAVYHNLSEKWLGFALINKRLDGEKTDPRSNYIRRSVYFSFWLLQRIFREGTGLLKSELSVKGSTDNQQLRISAFQNQDTTYIYIINKSDNKFVLHDLIIDSKKIDPDAQIEYSSVYGSTLYASRGLTNFKTTAQETLYFHTDTTVLKDLELKPYGFGLLKLVRNNSSQ